jgi:hypothetical protein
MYLHNFLCTLFHFFVFRLIDLQNGIDRYTNIEPESQLLICNNLLLTSIVGPDDEIGSYGIKMDDKNPIICIDLKNCLSLKMDFGICNCKYIFNSSILKKI